ncbi:hypothetical protein BaRGS_00037930 [Batillaria attramentaria]|uniref:Uncharacterized protein n=1 Tax=Batillaria attramentaria TaxID=370345 RepID=A0ABD0J8C0_9CAEN
MPGPTACCSVVGLGHTPEAALFYDVGALSLNPSGHGRVAFWSWSKLPLTFYGCVFTSHGPLFFKDDSKRFAEETLWDMDE